MNSGQSLLPGRTLRRPGRSAKLQHFRGVQIDDGRLAEVLSPAAPVWVLHENALHAEGPVWQPAFERLLWSDVSNRRVLGWYPDGRVEVVIDGTYFINGNARDLRGNILHCEHGRRCISHSPGEILLYREPQPVITHYEGRRLNSPNDLTVAMDGAIWFTDPTFGILVPSQGSLADPELDHCSVYRFDVSLRELRRMADFEQPNGLAFAPDGRTLYVSDTSMALREIAGTVPGARHEIVAFDVADGGMLSNRRFFCQTDHGCPDGLTVDQRGWLWTAGGDGIHIWAPTRERLGFIPLPVVATNCEFGGVDGRRLFITATEYLFAIDLV